MEAELERGRKTGMWRAKPAIIWPELGVSAEAGRRQGPGDLCPLPPEGPLVGPNRAVCSGTQEALSNWPGGFALLWGTDAIAAEYQTRWSIWSWFPLSSQPPSLPAQFVVLQRGMEEYPS